MQGTSLLWRFLNNACAVRDLKPSRIERSLGPETCAQNGDENSPKLLLLNVFYSTEPAVWLTLDSSFQQLLNFLRFLSTWYCSALHSSVFWMVSILHLKVEYLICLRCRCVYGRTRNIKLPTFRTGFFCRRCASSTFRVIIKGEKFPYGATTFSFEIK